MPDPSFEDVVTCLYRVQLRFCVHTWQQRGPFDCPECRCAASNATQALIDAGLIAVADPLRG